MIMKKNYELQALLDLNGEIFIFENGFWVKFQAYEVDISKSIPHGIKYSISLHDRSNRRVLGFDNAHGIKLKKKQKYTAKKVTWDHKHKIDRTYSYEFESAGQLIEDFWEEAKEILSKPEKDGK